MEAYPNLSYGAPIPQYGVSPQAGLSSPGKPYNYLPQQAWGGQPAFAQVPEDQRVAMLLQRQIEDYQAGRINLDDNQIEQLAARAYQEGLPFEARSSGRRMLSNLLYNAGSSATLGLLNLISEKPKAFTESEEAMGTVGDILGFVPWLFGGGAGVKGLMKSGRLFGGGKAAKAGSKIIKGIEKDIPFAVTESSSPSSALKAGWSTIEKADEGIRRQMIDDVFTEVAGKGTKKAHAITGDAYQTAKTTVTKAQEIVNPEIKTLREDLAATRKEITKLRDGKKDIDITDDATRKKITAAQGKEDRLATELKDAQKQSLPSIDQVENAARRMHQERVSEMYGTQKASSKAGGDIVANNADQAADILAGYKEKYEAAGLGDIFETITKFHADEQIKVMEKLGSVDAFDAQIKSNLEKLVKTKNDAGDEIFKFGETKKELDYDPFSKEGKEKVKKLSAEQKGQIDEITKARNEKAKELFKKEGLEYTGWKNAQKQSSASRWVEDGQLTFGGNVLAEALVGGGTVGIHGFNEGLSEDGVGGAVGGLLGGALLGGGGTAVMMGAGRGLKGFFKGAGKEGKGVLSKWRTKGKTESSGTSKRGSRGKGTDKTKAPTKQEKAAQETAVKNKQKFDSIEKNMKEKTDKSWFRKDGKETPIDTLPPADKKLVEKFSEEELKRFKQMTKKGQQRFLRDFKAEQQA